MDKSPDAFRTISEVADWLGVPTHVLRFWESRFSQVKPVKRAGGRRYYRPADMVLLGGIKRLLHDEGLTIRGVQKMLREEGVRHVSSYSQPLDGSEPMRDVTAHEDATPMAVDVEPEPVTGNVVPLVPAHAAPVAARPEPAPEEEAVTPPPAPEPEAAPEEITPGEITPGEITPGEITPGEITPEEPAPLILRGQVPQETPAQDVPETAHHDPAPPVAPAETALTDAAPPPGDAPEARPAEEEERMPEFSFLRHRARAFASPPFQPDLFGEAAAEAPETSPEAEAAPQPSEAAAPHAIPATPDVPAADAADDDPDIAVLPGMAARLATGRVLADHAVLARVVAELRDLRARL